MNNKNIRSIIALISAILLCVGALAACTPSGTQESSTGTDPETVTETNTVETVSDETVSNETVTENTETDETDTSSSNTEKESDTETKEVLPGPTLEGDYASLIDTSNRYANGVSLYYANGTRNDVVIENQSMTLNYHTNALESKLVSYINNKDGKSYIQNTMDAFVKMKGDNTRYFASGSQNPATMNNYRYGYYYYQVLIEGQDFAQEMTVTGATFLSTIKADSKLGMAETQVSDGYAYQITNTRDPQISYKSTFVPLDTAKYNHIALTMKVDAKDTTELATASMYLIAGSSVNFNEGQKKAFPLVADGEFHTYYIRIDTVNDYTGQIKGIRFDLDGNLGDIFTVKDVQAVMADEVGISTLGVSRVFNTYSDKLIHTMQVTATKDTADIEEIGLVTKVAANTVEKLIIKDKNGTHTSLEGVDFASAEYVGFDIKDVGIFGYILIPDETSGKMTVTLEGDDYVITQSRAPAGNTLITPTSETLHVNDFYMGQRIYTDESHDFDAFLKEAYLERNPLPAENIVVNVEGSDDGAFVRYNVLRGTYEFNIATSGFNIAYYEKQNWQPTLHFTVKGDEYDRVIYIETKSEAGQLECAVILDKNDLLLPVPVEVFKNFSDGDYSIHMIQDIPESNLYFPLPIAAKDETEIKVAHLYQNWGRFPLKQISTIQFGCPYYHLSTGVTETNCITPWYTTGGTRLISSTLPDHRAMSAPLWLREPQHTFGGSHTFLQYTDAEGNYSASENVKNTITSYGPTYAEIVMDYISDDGKISVTYTHMEMPQTDENRTYYLMEYEVLEDIEIAEFRKDFQFYSLGPKTDVTYQYLGYLDESNKSVNRPTNTKDKARTYILGDNCPYFSLYRDDNCTSRDGYVNVSFMIAESKFCIGGKEVTPDFIITDLNKTVSLSLDLGKVTLKKGDTFTIKAIIMPWGSQESDYTLHDKNVTDVRADSILNPLKAVADKSCTVVDTAFLPTLHSEDGKNAEFTVSGGANNCTVKITGLTQITVPTVYEQIEGEWVRYNLSSHYYPDKSGNTHDYDGYGIQYENGYFSYSFVVDMGEEGAARSFRFVADDAAFEPEVEPETVETQIETVEVIEGYNYYYGPKEIEEKLTASRGYGKKVLSVDGTYISIYGDGASGDPQVYIHSLANETDPKHTGRYMIFKYRLPATNQKSHWFHIFSSTKSPSASGSAALSYTSVKQDDKWYVAVVDWAAILGENYSPEADGGYYAQHVRMDFFNTVTPKEDRIDLAFIAFDDQFDSILEANKDMENIIFYNGQYHEIKTDGGKLPVEFFDDKSENTTPFEVYLSAKKLAYIANQGNSGFGAFELSEDESVFSVYSNPNVAESYFTPYKANADAPAVTGQYLVLKYKAAGVERNYFDIYATTVDEKAASSNNFTITGSNAYSTEDAWNLVILDLAAINPATIAADENGNYSLKFLRFDIFNTKYDTADYKVDLAYIAVCSNLEAALTFDKSVETVSVLGAEKAVTVFSTETGEEITK